MRPLFPARAYLTALAVLALRLLFPARAERTAIAVLARRPHSLVLAYTLAAAFDAPRLPFLVWAFFENLGHSGLGLGCVGGVEPFHL